MQKANKNDRITFRLTPEQRQLIEEKADKAMIPVSTFCRIAAMNRPVNVVLDGKEVARQLVAIGNNLNQLTVLAHEGKVAVASLEQCREQLSEINHRMIQILSAVAR